MSGTVSGAGGDHAATPAGAGASAGGGGSAGMPSLEHGPVFVQGPGAIAGPPPGTPVQHSAMASAIAPGTPETIVIPATDKYFVFPNGGGVHVPVGSTGFEFTWSTGDGTVHTVKQSFPPGPLTTLRNPAGG